MPSILVLHGPNLNLLGTREPAVYGSATLDEVNLQIEAHAALRKVQVRCIQSNHEGVLVDALQEAGRGTADAVVLNAGGFTHSSVAIRDAVVACGLPVIEVHLSNVAARESFRHTSILASAVVGQIAGFGVDSYLLGLDAAVATLNKAAGTGSGRG